MQDTEKPLNKDLDIDRLKIQSDSSQMTLFEIIEPYSRRGELSNTVAVYDSLPKYVWDQSGLVDDLSQAIITRKCKIQGNEYIIKIKPAMIERNGKTILVYAGQREELVEDALRKIAVSGSGSLIEGKAGVTFSLNELQAELSSTGHTFSWGEIQEAIMVCRGATLECHSADGDTFISSSFFPMVGITTRTQYLEKKGEAKCYVQFNPFVNDSIMKLTFRQYSYKIGMKIKSPLARFIYKRMCHYWTQASSEAPYTPSLVSFLSQSPREFSPRMADNLRAMKNALDALITEGVVSDYDANQIKDGRKITDVRYRIRPTDSFVTQTKAANHSSNRAELKSLRLQMKLKTKTPPPVIE